ncbi:MAG: hypothetical protein AAF639_02430 [Chloroflexota bacterium]
MLNTASLNMQSSGIRYTGFNGWTSLVNRLSNGNRFIAWNLHFYLATLIVTLAFLFIDTRIVTGQLVWMKPLKFAISILIYTLTMLWMVSFVDTQNRLKRWLVNMLITGTVIGFLVEMGGIWIQAFRGVRSHFNIGTTFDMTIFSLMGTFVVVIWAMNLVAALLLLFERLPNKAFAWSLRWALVLTFIGAGIAWLMTAPTVTQQQEIAQALEGGPMPTLVGAHSVGVEDGGAGMPITGWSTEGGDLRIPHFVGLHALQIIPLMGILIQRRYGQRNRKNRKLSENRQTALVWIGSLGYLGLTGILTWQALRGQPLIAPDALTLGSLGLLISAVALAWWLVSRQRVGIE